MKTFIEYMYSDAGNFKKYGQFIVDGNVVQSDIECYLFEGEFFIPEYVGVPSLAPLVFSEEDHPLHRFVSLSPCIEGAALFSAAQFVEFMKSESDLKWQYKRSHIKKILSHAVIKNTDGGKDAC